jgi:hypothetical protein
LFGPIRPADRGPSRFGQLECIRGCGGLSHDQQATRAWCLEWPLRRGIRTRYISVCHYLAEPLANTRAVTREGMCWEQSHEKRTIATPRSDDNQLLTRRPRRRPNHQQAYETQHRRKRTRLPVSSQSVGNRTHLTSSYRNGCIVRQLEEFTVRRVGLFHLSRSRAIPPHRRGA